MNVSTAIEKLLAIELDNKATAEKWKKLFTGFTPEDEKEGIWVIFQ